MDVLFVCRANLRRRQIASAFFDRLSQHTPETIVAMIGGEGRTMLERVQGDPEENPTSMMDIMTKKV